MSAPKKGAASPKTSPVKKKITKAKPNKTAPKTKRKSDPGYNPRRDSARRKNPSAGDNVLAMRTSNTATVTDHKGNKVPLKLAMLINSKVCTKNNYDMAKMSKELDKQFSLIPYNRPVAAIVAVSADDSPEKIMTPKGTILDKKARWKLGSMFDNDATKESVSKNSVIRKINFDSDFFTSPEFHALKLALSKVKFVRTQVTETQLNKTSAENHKRGNTRSSSQPQQMVKPGVNAKEGSANRYAKETKLFSGNMRWEWLHLIAHFILGAAAQTDKNLVGGSYDANTEMLLFELQTKELASKYPDGFKLEVTATLIESTKGQPIQIATEIKYKIMTPDFVIAPSFNAQTRNKPHITYKDYVNGLFQTLLVTSKLRSRKALSGSTTAVPLPFYQKRKTAPANDSQPAKKIKSNIKP